MITLPKESINVVPIHAEHCIGGVMFLISGSFGCYLYTADFRYTKSLVQNINKNIQGPIKTMYIYMIFLINNE